MIAAGSCRAPRRPRSRSPERSSSSSGIVRTSLGGRVQVGPSGVEGGANSRPRLKARGRAGIIPWVERLITRCLLTLHTLPALLAVCTRAVGGNCIGQKVLVPALAVLALSTSAVAEADPAVGGFLSLRSGDPVSEEVLSSCSADAPEGQSRDFFRTKRPITVKSCTRVNRPTVICRFSLILNPDAAHRRAHWFPIRCRGKVRSRHRVDNSIVGDVRGYRCRTILQRK